MATKKISWGKSKSPQNSTNFPNSTLFPVSDSCNIAINESPDPVEPNVPEPKIVLANKFEGIYTTDYDINSIHHSILHNFEKELNHKLPELQKKLQQVQSTLTKVSKPLDKRIIKNEIETIINNINQINNQERKKQYLEEAKELIPQYLQIASEKKIISFKTKKTISETELKNQILLQEKRHQIIHDYLEIARSYIDVNLIRETPKRNECDQCKFDFNLLDDEIEFCPGCGLEHRNILKIPIYLEACNSKATDEKNFMKEFKRFQGLQNIKLPDSLIEDLDKYFKSYGFKTGAEVKLLPLNKDGERIGTNHEMLREALQKTNNTSYYEDINLILNVYWDYPLPDVSHLETVIVEDYKKLQKAFLEIDKNRTSSLNAQYRLYKQLQLRGYKCKSSQFKSIKTDAISQKYAEIWKQMCELAGYDYIPD